MATILHTITSSHDLCNVCQDMLAKDERGEALCQHEGFARKSESRASSDVSLGWTVKLKEREEVHT